MDHNKKFLYGSVPTPNLSSKDMISMLHKRIEENIEFYFPEAAARDVRIVGKPWGGTGTGRTFKFRILSPNSKVNHDLFIKVSPKFETLNPGTSEYEALKLLYPRMPLIAKGCHVPRPLDFFYDLNALLTESVGNKSFREYLLKKNSKKSGVESLSDLCSTVAGCGHWLGSFHEITKNGKFVKFDSSELIETFRRDFERLKRLGLFKFVLAELETTFYSLRLLNERFLMPVAMWHYDFTPGHVFIDNNKITVIDILGLENAIYEDIGKWLSAMGTVNSFPLYLYFDYERANSKLGDVFLEAYVSHTALDKDEFILLSNIFKLKYLVWTFLVQNERISQKIHPAAAKMFARLRLRKIYQNNILRTINTISEKMESLR
jgi:hypothetical protein